jgi:hypothetical protein
MHKMAKTFHRKTDGSIVVKDGAKIVGNLPGKPRSINGAPIAASIPKLPGADKLEAVAPKRPKTQPAQPFSAEIAAIDENITFLKDALISDPDAVVLVSDLDDITVPHSFAPDEELTLKQALDLYRLEKAIFREAQTNLALKEDKKNGVKLIQSFGNGKLGDAEKEAFNEPNTKEWLLARTNGIGGSDKLGYVDESGEFVPYDSIGKKNYLNSVLAEKSPKAVASIESSEVAVVDEIDQALPLRIGNHLERTIQYEFAKNHSEYNHFDDKNTRTAKGRPWHRFNPDGVLQDKSTEEFGIFEAKTSRDVATFEKALPGYLSQCLHNASAANLKFAVLVADIEGEKGQFVYRVDFTDKQLQDYRDTVDRAWLLYKPRYDKREAKGEIG